MSANISNLPPKSNQKIPDAQDINYWHKQRPYPLWQSDSYLGNEALCKISDVVEIRQGLVLIQDSTGKKRRNPVPDRSVSDIKRFSYNSRLRLMRLCASVDMSSYRDIIHCTFTFHDNFPVQSPTIKLLFHNFYVQLRQIYPFCSLIWRLEFQQRGAPHYHFIILFKRKVYGDNLEALRMQLSNTWRKCMKIDSIASIYHAVKCTRCADYKKFFTYVSKYSAKVEDENVPRYTGRRWGYTDNLSVGLKAIHCPSNLLIKLFKKKLKAFLLSENRLSDKLAQIFDDATCLTIFIDHEIASRLYNDCLAEYLII